MLHLSIIGETSGPKHLTGADVIILAAWGAVALGLAIFLRVFRRHSIEGPARAAGSEVLSPMLMTFLGGVMIWLLLPAMLLALTGATPGDWSGGGSSAPATMPATGPTTLPATSPSTHPAAGPATSPTTVTATQPATRPTPRVSRMAIMLAQTLSATLALIVLVVANRVMRGVNAEKLGLGVRRAPAGMLVGLAGTIIAVWVVYVVATLTELVWRSLQYKHPTEHELLKLLTQGPQWIEYVLLIVSATLVAPLFEEVLFRGYLQTLLTHGLNRWVNPPPGSRGAGGVGVVALGELPSLEPPVPVEVWQEKPPAAWVRWVAVLIASLAFAAVHDAWTMPPIFVLSIILGYAYERTGNLWVPITIHAGFNLTGTLLYLGANVR